MGETIVAELFRIISSAMLYIKNPWNSLMDKEMSHVAKSNFIVYPASTLTSSIL